jgi:hypothetical protein
MGHLAANLNNGNYGTHIGYQAGGSNSKAESITIHANGDGSSLTTASVGDIRIATPRAEMGYLDDGTGFQFIADVDGTPETATINPDTGVYVFPNLPTADPANAGQLWNDAGTLKVSAG